MPPKTSMKAAMKRDEPKSAVEVVASHGQPQRSYAPDPFAVAMVTASSSRSAEPEIRPGFKMVKAREVLPHVSVYLHPKVIARFKEIAAVEGKRAHAVYLDALDHYLTTKHGVSLESLSRE